jgi:hypothetical protein
MSVSLSVVTTAVSSAKVAVGDPGEVGRSAVIAGVNYIENILLGF